MNGINADRFQPRLNFGFDVICVHPIHRRLRKDWAGDAQVLKVPAHGRLAAITVAVIMVISNMNPSLNPVINAALRFSESYIGAATAAAIVLLTPRTEPAS
jgi:hypothetical protein